MSRGPRLAEIVVGVHTSARRPAQHPSRERPSPSCERSSAVAACSEPQWWSAEAVNSGQLNWECRSLSDRRISSSSSLPIWVSAWDGTIADHGAGSQVWVITRFRVITRPQPTCMLAAQTRGLLTTIRQRPQGTRRPQTTPVGRVCQRTGAGGRNLRERAEAAWGG